MNDWLEYKDEANGEFLRNFFQEYFYKDDVLIDTFTIEYIDGNIYDCVLKTSKSMKGLTYIRGENIDTGEFRNFAVGDDSIIKWLPPVVENDLMVG